MPETQYLVVPEVPAHDPQDDRPLYRAAMLYGAAKLYIGPVAGHGESAFKNPGSLLGRCWQSKTVTGGADAYAMFAEDYPQAVGIALHCGRTGILATDIDDPSTAPELLTRAITEHNPPRFSTRRGQPERVTALWLLPPGRTIGNSGGKLGAAWGDVRGTNGVVILPGSQHADHANDGLYDWQVTGPIPMLPAYLAELLPDATETAEAVSDTQVADFLHRNIGQLKPSAIKGLLTAFEREAIGHGRHTTAVKIVTWGMREALAGLYPAQDAADELRAAFTAAIAGERRTDSEWRGILSWAVGQALTATPERLAEIRDKAINGQPTHEPTDDTAGEDRAPIVAPRNLPEEFWSARPSLKLIREVAHQRGRSADAVLGGVLARYAAAMPPRIGPDTGLGGGAVSLNFFAAAVGPSGAGKSSALKVAQQLLPDGMCPPEMPMGSGEGLSEAYMGSVDEEKPDANGKVKPVRVRKKVRDNALITLDEGVELVNVMAGRQGATIGGALRSAWVGETIGQQNGRAETTRIVPEGTYAMGVTIGFQEEAAATLLTPEQAALGTVQRFVWFNASDPTIPDEADPIPFGRLTPPGDNWQGAADGALHIRRMTLPKDICVALRRADLAKQRGEVQVAALDSHKPLTLIKLSALLALLDGRSDIEQEDWTLAEMLWTVSCAIRASILDGKRMADEKAARDAVKKFARRQVLVAEHVAEHNGNRLYRVAGTLARAVHGVGRLTPGKARNKLRSGDREQYPEAMAYAIEQEWITEQDGALLPGSTTPPGSDSQ